MSLRSIVAESRVRRAGLLLRIGVAVQCGTLAWLAACHGTSLDTLLFMELGTQAAAAVLADRLLALCLMVLAAVLLLRSCGRATITAAIGAALAFLTVALAQRFVGGRAFAELSPLGHATRWLAPLAIVALCARPPAPVTPGRIEAASWVLRIAVATTFAIHGLQALGDHPAFLDLLIGSARRWIDTAPSESSARTVLTVVGAADLIVAALLLTVRWPPIAAWAAVWGLSTAAARAVALGGDFMHESLLRTMNAVAPLALWLLWTATRSRPPR